MRLKPNDITNAGVQTGTSSGRRARTACPKLEDGRTLDVTNVIWCTGFRPNSAWIDLPVLDQEGFPEHERGIATAEPRLAFVGFPFLRAVSSGMIHGLWSDAKHIGDHIAAQATGHHPTDTLLKRGQPAGAGPSDASCG